MPEKKQQRILIVDDNAAIHSDFRKILQDKNDIDTLEETRKALFGTDEKETHDLKPNFIVDSAYQGQEALELVQKLKNINEFYTLAFVDIRMPPGWDGITTIKKLWEVDPNIQIVICSAYGDYSFEEISKELKTFENYLILKKPFDVIEIRQLAFTMTKKWELRTQVENQIKDLNAMVAERTVELENALSLIRTTLNSTHEGIVAVNNDGIITISNKVFLDFWKIDETFIKNKRAHDVFHKLAAQIEKPEMFLQALHNKVQRSTSAKEYALRSGSIIEFHMRPQMQEDRVIGYVYSFRDITERKNLETLLLHQATHDTLTGLPNRILLNDRLLQTVLQAKRSGTMVGVYLLNIDHFKQVNDTLGRDVGDAVLKLCANRIKKDLRESDTVTRLGNDEFVIVLSPITNEEDIIKKAAELQNIFITPFEVDNRKLTITVSTGISVFPRDGQDPEVLIKNADAALTYAKDAGRNTFQIYKSEFNETNTRRAALTTALREAEKDDQFVLHYQPLIDLKTGKIIGVEALLRWLHPELGLVAPNVFIPLAEESGLIVSIGEWVLRTACRQVHQWQSILPDLFVAVNISVHQFRQSNFVETITRILGETHLQPRLLELEVTENLLIGNTSDVSQKMIKLKQFGVRFAMDDFGTGYASLSYLKYFPFDKVKIDKSFVSGISSSTEDRSIIEAIINMAKGLGLEVLAEGVETEEQVSFLRSRHSNHVQGYYYSPGLDAETCTDLLKKQSFTTTS